MSSQKADYPYRPARKGVPKSSQSGGGRRKCWVSLVENTDGRMDLGKRQNFPWYKAPLYVEARMKKWGTN